MTRRHTCNLAVAGWRSATHVDGIDTLQLTTTLNALRAPVTRESQPLESCSVCRYWLRPESTYCNDCGSRSSHSAATWRAAIRRRGWIAGAIAGAIALPVLAVLIGAGAGVALAAVAAGAGLGALGGRRAARAIVERRARGRLPGDDCLTAGEIQVVARLGEVKSRLARLHASRETVHDVMSSAERQDTALALIWDKYSVRVDERHALELRRWQIAFARWVNALAPVLENIERISYDEADRRLVVATGLRNFAVALVDAWAASPTGVTSDAASFLVRFRDAVTGVATIIDELAMRKALLADPDATRLRVIEVDDAVARELERFARLEAEIAGGGFAIAADELEHERLRLAGESELAA